MIVPALQGLGTPFLDDRARGLVIGLTRGSSRAQLVRGLLEGVAQRCADLCEALPVGPGPLRVDGGLARSDVLLQSLSDLAGRPLYRAAELETTALGAGLLAGLAVGVLPDLSACRRAAPGCERFRPGLSDTERRGARDAWRRALERARGDFPPAPLPVRTPPRSRARR